MKGKLITIESGTDGSGKKTQANKLYERLAGESYKVKKVEFPNYNSDSSALVKMYLNGDFGDDPNDVDPYIASTFYSVDRYASYKVEWEEFFLSGGIIITDRYTTSNMIHQGAKFNNVEEKEKFLDWLREFEFSLYKLPEPDLVIFLDMPTEFSADLIKERNKSNSIKDIHEQNDDYLISSYNNALYIANKYGWKKINCVKNNKIRTVDDIHEEIYNYVKQLI